MALKFETEKLIKDFLEKLKKELEDAGKAWENDASSKMRGIKFAHERENIKAEVKSKVLKIIQQKAQGLEMYLKANAVALADSYGVGSLMTTDNPGLKEYMKSDRWNPVRRGKEIVGRPEGNYTDIFGRNRHSSGSLKGVKLEGKRVYTKNNDNENDYYISPSHPSYAIQLANNWLYKTYLPRAYKLATQQINFAKYLIEIN